MAKIASISLTGRIFPAIVFDQLSSTLRKIASESGDTVTSISDALLLPPNLLQHNIKRFLIVASPRFSGYLIGQSITEEISTLSLDTKLFSSLRTDQVIWEQYRTSISFDPAEIAALLDILKQASPANPDVNLLLDRASQCLQPNDSQLQGQFALQLAEIMMPQADSLIGSRCSVELPLLESEQQQTEQDRVFSQVANQIRQIQELPHILAMAVQQVCLFLQADRVVIYEFDQQALESSSKVDTSSQANVQTEIDVVDPANQLICGRVAYESRINPGIPQILNLSEGMQCLIGVADYREKYRKGTIQIIDDIRRTYAETPCLMTLLERAKVRAKLVVPIVVQEQLWGLLIAHQCSDMRTWLESETHFLKCIAELLAIAIRQNHLYIQLQQQTQTLEQQVVERTQELRDALKASQTAGSAKTEFLASVSHELRTPLTAIIGLATTLMRLPQGSNRERLLSVEKQQDYLRIIRNSGEHLLELINDILDLSQVEAGRTILEIQEFSISQVVNESLRILRNKAQQNDIVLELDLRILTPHSTLTTSKSWETETDSSNPDRFIADARRVKQILLNLLSNAIKFTPQGGTVTLRVWREQESVIFQVQDTGIGIPAHQFPLLFKKFQQLDTSYHRQYEGTGLGLALTKQLVDLHGGQIEVESIVNLGSTFTVKLPMQTPTVRKKAAQTEDDNLDVEGRIVLVEQQESYANLICDLLTSAGYQVIWMVDGMTALQQIEFLKPEVVVVNTHLPRMSATDFLQCLRQNSETATTQVLILIDRDVLGSDRCLEEGANDYLDMPLTYPEELLDKVAALIEKAKQVNVKKPELEAET